MSLMIKVNLVIFQYTNMYYLFILLYNLSNPMSPFHIHIVQCEYMFQKIDFEKNMRFPKV